jgi:hypothetical protein
MTVLLCGQRDFQHAQFEVLRCDAAGGFRAGVWKRRCSPPALSLRRATDAR